jgi:DNA-binding NarL/FixJ family response regulator
MKKELAIKVGAATKYKKVKLDVAKIIALYKSGKPVSQIALAIGYPANTGNNRVRNILMKADVYKKPAKAKAAKKKAA